MNKMQYGVKHKTTGLFFGGFNPDDSVRWVIESQAKRLDKSQARGQALLFRSHDIAAQVEPATI